MARPERLDDDHISERLATLPGWERQGDEIVKTFELATFPDAITFVTRIAERAEAANHHPDIDIRWRKVRVARHAVRRRAARRARPSWLHRGEALGLRRAARARRDRRAGRGRPARELARCRGGHRRGRAPRWVVCAQPRRDGAPQRSLAGR